MGILPYGTVYIIQIVSRQTLSGEGINLINQEPNMQCAFGEFESKSSFSVFTWAVTEKQG